MLIASLLGFLQYHQAVNAALGDGASAAGLELDAMASAYTAATAPEAFAERVRAARESRAATGRIRPSHAQQNRWADDAGDSCDCGHAKWQHNDDGRCRAQRSRCRCRTYVRVGASARVN